MDPTISVSKGCFVFKNGATRAGKRKSSAGAKRKRKAGNSGSALGHEITGQPFYNVYSETWQKLEQHIEQLQQSGYACTLDELVAYVANECDAAARGIDSYDMEEILPAAALLTGINQPDHLEQFQTLTQRLLKRLNAVVCMLQSRDCATLKSAVETMVYNFIETTHTQLPSDDEVEEEEERTQKRVRRSECTMRHLERWYCEKYPAETEEEQHDAENTQQSSDDDDILASAKSYSRRAHPLVIILPDFECFNATVLQDFILVLSAHCAQLPFVLIFGVATSVSAVHGTLSYHVTSKIKLRVFQTQPAPVCLNEILDRVILSPQYAFHLSGKVFKFLTHIFLYYDFSIHGFIQGYKYCLMEHFFQGNAYALCSGYAASLQRIKALTHDDIESIRHLLSFRPYVEGINDCKRIIAILTDDNYLKKKLPQLLRDCHIHFVLFRIFLEFLTALVGDLPKCLLGKHRRELYALCLSKDLTTLPEFKECWQMLSLMSKHEFVAKISKAVSDTEQYLQSMITNAQLELVDDCAPIVQQQLQSIKDLLTKVVMAGMDAKTPAAAPTTNNANTPESKQQFATRHDLKEHLLQLSKQQKPTTEFAQAVTALLQRIQTDIVTRYLAPLERAPPLHELFVFSDVATVRRNIIGAPRAALHMALNNPHYYLQCKCCQLTESTQLVPTLPDLSVVYKLHLECGRMINLFDWLQAFRAVVDDNEEELEQVDPQIQARFTRAVAELQFLGYIKMSKRKTDHATRLTW